MMIKTQNKCAQATIEFVLTMIIVMLMIYGMVMIFRWAGVGLAERRMVHEKSLVVPIKENWVWTNASTIAKGPLKQLDPNFYRSRKLRAVFGE